MWSFFFEVFSDKYVSLVHPDVMKIFGMQSVLTCKKKPHCQLSNRIGSQRACCLCHGIAAAHHTALLSPPFSRENVLVGARNRT